MSSDWGPVEGIERPPSSLMEEGQFKTTSWRARSNSGLSRNLLLLPYLRNWSKKTPSICIYAFCFRQICYRIFYFDIS